MTIARKDIEAMIRLFEQSDWDELRLEVDGLRLVLSNDPAAAPLAAATSAVEPAAPAAAPTAAEPRPRLDAGLATEPAAESADGLAEITAPNLGTFYRAPKPGAAPYVELGQAIAETTEVCLIEVMKLFTPVKAGVSGTLAEICVEDGEMVEFGAPLFRVRPEAATTE